MKLLLLIYANLVFGTEFCSTYDQCRTKFRENANSYITSIIKIPSKIDTDLTLDTAYLPALTKQKKLLIISSGVHGVEGFIGSSIQSIILKEVLPTLSRNYTGILFLHSINPYGMKYYRRVSENNVDLNRNFDVNSKLFSIKNIGYNKVSALLNPKSKASFGFLAHAGFFVDTLRLLLKEKMESLRQAILQGQYENPQGIYFGGKDFEPQKNLIRDYVLKIAKEYSEFLILDLHTGYGKKGVLHLFPSAVGSKKIRTSMPQIFKGFRIEETSGSDFYDTYGDFSTYLAAELENNGKTTVSIVMEYGTMDSQTTKGAIESLRLVILENQMHWHGAHSLGDGDSIKNHFRAAYFPQDNDWKEKILKETKEKLEVIIRRFSE